MTCFARCWLATHFAKCVAGASGRFAKFYHCRIARLRSQSAKLHLAWELQIKIDPMHGSCILNPMRNEANSFAIAFAVIAGICCVIFNILILTGTFPGPFALPLFPMLLTAFVGDILAKEMLGESIAVTPLIQGIVVVIGILITMSCYYTLGYIIGSLAQDKKQ